MYIYILPLFNSVPCKYFKSLKTLIVDSHVQPGVHEFKDVFIRNKPRNKDASERSGLVPRKC